MATSTNPGVIPFESRDGESAHETRSFEALAEKHDLNDDNIKKVLEKYLLQEELKPYQAELIRQQQHLEETGKRMIILYEGRDAAGKGGTIRRVTRYRNEKHYRVIVMGKPTERQASQWFSRNMCPSFHGATK